MDGTKQATDTSDLERGRRKVFRGSRNSFERTGGSRENKNLANSNSEAGLETQPPEGLGFLSNDNQLRVSRS